MSTLVFVLLSTILLVPASILTLPEDAGSDKKENYSEKRGRLLC
jgi:hypothetical protein